MTHYKLQQLKGRILDEHLVCFATDLVLSGTLQVDCI